ncbi:MAG: hypothetical protein JXA89_11195 [Anaerolineae bacterium]|nr:hypothetical protein [Anaerolineae bacterium]
MSQRIYWVPHTLCFLGCAHCHNDSSRSGLRSTREHIDRIIAHLPGSESTYRLEDVLVGGGEALMRGAETEYLIRSFRDRFPRGGHGTVAERRAAGYVILALQTTGLPLADHQGNVRRKQVEYWLDLGVDYFQVASSDMFHRRQRPAFPWDVLECNLQTYGAAHGVEFHIYGKSVTKLVPSGRVLENLDALEMEGAGLLTAERYCADGWETASHFLSGTQLAYPQCSEVVIDPGGWVHSCCWYELSPGLFDLGHVDLATGLEKLRSVPFCLALDQGDILQIGRIVQVAPELAQDIRDRVGDCGACRLFSILLARQAEHGWLQVSPLSVRESAFYTKRLGANTVQRLLG